MNFAGVSWYIPGRDALDGESQPASHRRYPLPGLFVPFLGGVLIDRLGPPLLGCLARHRARLLRPRHGLHRVARATCNSGISTP